MRPPGAHHKHSPGGRQKGQDAASASGTMIELMTCTTVNLSMSAASNSDCV